MDPPICAQHVLIPGHQVPTHRVQVTLSSGTKTVMFGFKQDVNPGVLGESNVLPSLLLALSVFVNYIMLCSCSDGLHWSYIEAWRSLVRRYLTTCVTELLSNLHIYMLKADSCKNNPSQSSLMTL